MKGRTKNIKFKFYSKYLFVISFLVLAVFLAGCDGVFSPATQAPIITSTPITSATVGLLYAYDVNATDPDGDILTYSFYSIYTAPNGMTINSTTGVISWTPTSIQIGNTLVMVKVSDGTLSATQSFTIVVSEPSVIAEDNFESGTLQGGFGWIDSEWYGDGYAAAQPSNDAEEGSYIAIVWGISEGSYIWRSVDLSSTIKPRLQFWVKPKDLWSYFDWKDTAVVQISEDNENWWPIATWVGSVVGYFAEPWSFIDYDLSSYVGASQFWIKFTVVDNSAHPLGLYPMLYIDDLKIVDLN